MAYQTYPLGLPQKQEQTQPPVAEVSVDPKVDPYTELLLKDAQGNITQLSIENGDLIATAIKGPNYGKKCNLTYGRWA